MADLTGKTVKSTYKDLLKISPDSDNSGLEGAMKNVTDGEGQSSALHMSTTKVKIDDLEATTADINGGTVDNTSIGSSGRSTGEFSSLGVAGSAGNSGTKLHRENKTQLEFGDLVFQKTGVCCGELNSKLPYAILAVELHGIADKGNFMVNIELQATTGTATTTGVGVSADPSTFTPDGVGFSWARANMGGMQRGDYSATNADTYANAKTLHYDGYHEYFNGGFSISSGSAGPLSPFKHQHGLAFAKNDTTGDSNIYPGDGHTLLNLGESINDRRQNFPGSSNTGLIEHYGHSAIYQYNLGDKIPLASDSYRWIDYNNEIDNNTGFENSTVGSDGWDANSPSAITEANLPVWAPPGSTIPDPYNVERTWEIAAQIGTPTSDDTGHYWPISVRYGSAGPSSIDNLNQVVCITYNIKVISSYNGVGGKGYVKGIREVW